MSLSRAVLVQQSADCEESSRAKGSCKSGVQRCFRSRIETYSKTKIWPSKEKITKKIRKQITCTHSVRRRAVIAGCATVCQVRVQYYQGKACNDSGVDTLRANGLGLPGPPPICLANFNKYPSSRYATLPDRAALSTQTALESQLRQLPSSPITLRAVAAATFEF